MKNIFLFILCVYSTKSNAQNSPLPTKQIVLKKGQVITAVTTLSMETEGQTGKNFTSTNFITVLDAIDPGYTISSKVNKISTSSAEQTQNYDADKKTAENAEIEKHLSEQFLVLNKYTGKCMPYKTPDTAKANSDKSMEKMTFQMLFGNSLDGAFFIIPSEKKIHESWNYADSSENSKLDYTYTLESINTDSAKVTYKGTNFTHRIMDINSMQAIMKTDEHLSGEIYVSTRTGLVSKKTILSKSEGTVEVMGQISAVNSTTATNISYNY